MGIYLLAFVLCFCSCAFHGREIFQCYRSPIVCKIKAVTYLVHAPVYHDAGICVLKLLGEWCWYDVLSSVPAEYLVLQKVTLRGQRWCTLASFLFSLCYYFSLFLRHWIWLNKALTDKQKILCCNSSQACFFLLRETSSYVNYWKMFMLTVCWKPL